MRLDPLHDFAAKLLQPAAIEALKAYVRLQAALRARLAAGEPVDDLVASVGDVPVSFNLDITTACNFRCDHCVDLDILNKGIRFDHEQLEASLKNLAGCGLRSVIIIGGGEPTIYPRFVEVVRLMKDLGLSVGIVTNGTGNEKILEVADRLDRDDWVRLSLDAGTDATFQAMHHPRRPITLDAICEGVPPIRDRNPAVPVGFSYVITWDGAQGNGVRIHENLHEMVEAAERARRWRFSYISFKPFLTRSETNNVEVVDLRATSGVENVVDVIRRNVAEAKRLATDDFKVIESTNLKMLEGGAERPIPRQPRNCHMQWFRQVLSPLGLYNCPANRNQEHGRIGGRHDYATEDGLRAAQAATLDLIERFDASEVCREVTCLYNQVNWFIEGLIRNPERLEGIQGAPDRRDYFL